MKLHPMVDAKSWCLQHGIAPTPVRCPNCGNEIELSIPFATRNLRGIEAELHECGEKFRAFRVVHVDGQLAKILNGTLEDLK